MAEATEKRYLINKIITVDLKNDTDPETGGPYPWDAGVRVNGVDKMTPFAIPGSGLPPRHCNVETCVTVAVASDMTVFMSMHGKSDSDSRSIWQEVFGRDYYCKMFVCPHFFRMNVPVGSNGWSGVRFFDSQGEPIPSENHGCTSPCISELVPQCELKKGYEKSLYKFDWQFGGCIELIEGQEYYENEILQDKTYTTNHDNGFSTSKSTFVKVGNLTDLGWKQEMGDSDNGHIYLCGGIVYQHATVTADITADAVEITIPGLNLASFYYPGDTQSIERVSLNRPGGYFMIYDPTFQAEWLEDEKIGNWRPIKNTEDDKGVARGNYENTGHRLIDPDSNYWVRLIITGRGGVPDGEDINGQEVGIGADDSSNGNGNGNCCGCCFSK